MAEESVIANKFVAVKGLLQDQKARLDRARFYTEVYGEIGRLKNLVKIQGKVNNQQDQAKVATPEGRSLPTSNAKKTLTSLLENVRESNHRLQINVDLQQEEAVCSEKKEKPLTAMKGLLADVRESNRFLINLAKVQDQKKELEMQQREYESYKNFGSEALKKLQAIRSGVTNSKVSGKSYRYRVDYSSSNPIFSFKCVT